VRVLIEFVLIILAFGGGYWLEHSQYSAANSKAESASAQLASAEDTLDVYHLQDQVLTLVQDTTNKNYGDAATVSTKFFDDLSAEIGRTSDPGVKSALQPMLNQRDEVTAALAKGDPKAHDLFVQLLDSFRQVLAKLGSHSA
jgi:hypothetical protein